MYREPAYFLTRNRLGLRRKPSRYWVRFWDGRQGLTGTAVVLRQKPSAEIKLSFGRIIGRRVVVRIVIGPPVANYNRSIPITLIS